ncbi:MAG: sigma-54 dependent transcriptional regulator [Desulfatirhabdiaceae bacterium]
MDQILIIDDNEQLCITLSQLVRRLGMTVAYEMTLQKGLKNALSNNYDIVFLDINLPDGNGLDRIKELRDLPFPPEIIIITGYSDDNGAEIAIKNGVWDYIEKSASMQNIRLSLTRAVQYRNQKKERPARVALKRDAIIGSSPQIVVCLDEAAQAANSDSPVLLTGETGTGKELFARAIHENSRQSAGNFVVVDCAALPEHLVESMLLGHRKGAFTGSVGNHEGLIRQADTGTLFLDEIGEMPIGIQKKFLRVLQEKRFRPVGSETETHSNFRLICATHRNLEDMVVNGLFRQDLYYRICTIYIALPPLRDRPKDIPNLVLHRISQSSIRMGERSHGLTPDFLESLMAYPWPGNVRELFNTIDQVLARALDEPVLFSSHLPTNIRTSVIKQKLTRSPKNTPVAPGRVEPQKIASLSPLKEYLENVKGQYVNNLMRQTKGNISEACRISGLSRAYLYQLVQKYDIPVTFVKKSVDQN